MWVIIGTVAAGITLFQVEDSTKRYDTKVACEQARPSREAKLVEVMLPHNVRVVGSECLYVPTQPA